MTQEILDVALVRELAEKIKKIKPVPVSTCLDCGRQWYLVTTLRLKEPVNMRCSEIGERCNESREDS